MVVPFSLPRVNAEVIVGAQLTVPDTCSKKCRIQVVGMWISLRDIQLGDAVPYLIADLCFRDLVPAIGCSSIGCATGIATPTAASNEVTMKSWFSCMGM